MPDLETARLRLHALTAEEAEALGAGEPPAGWAYASGFPMPDTRDGVGLFLRHGDQAFGFHFVVRLEDQLVIGEIGFVGPPQNAAVTIGYAIVPAARGQGYATEALSVLLDWARQQSGLTCVLADTTRSNLASQRLLERVGLHRIGEDGELLYYML